MRGSAVTYSTPGGISCRRQRLRMPSSFMAGVMARQMVVPERSGSATTRFAVIGSRPRARHSTEA